jgi:hypothetical protein
MIPLYSIQGRMSLSGQPIEEWKEWTPFAGYYSQGMEQRDRVTGMLIDPKGPSTITGTIIPHSQDVSNPQLDLQLVQQYARGRPRKWQLRFLPEQNIWAGTSTKDRKLNVYAQITPDWLFNIQLNERLQLETIVKGLTADPGEFMHRAFAQSVRQT